MRRASLATAGAGVAAVAAGAPARAGELGGASDVRRAVQYVHPHGSDANDGTSPDSPKRSWAAALAALPSEGGVLSVAQGVYETGVPVAVSGTAVDVVCEPGAVLRATAGMGAVLTYDRVVDAPGVGVHGLTIDMNGLAATGLEVRDCWLTHHTLKVLRPGGGTGVRLYTEHPDFGCYYNRILLKCTPPSGSTAAGSTGILVEGRRAGHATNHNTLVDCRIGNVETGIRIGPFTDANTIARPDCTGCSVGYDLTSGATHLLHAWDEGNGRGVVVRSGAVAHLVSTLYSERQHVEGTGVLYRDGHVVTGHGATDPIDRVRRRSDGPELRERFDPRDGALSWVARGPAGERALMALDQGGRLMREGYDEYATVPTPAAPGGGSVRLFARAGGSGAVELCARLPSGATTVLASDAPKGAAGPAPVRRRKRRRLKKKRRVRRRARTRRRVSPRARTRRRRRRR